MQQTSSNPITLFPCECFFTAHPSFALFSQVLRYVPDTLFGWIPFVARGTQAA